MRPVAKGDTPKDDAGTEIEFSEYARARHYLIDRIDEYCSYCERKIPANLAVEHVQPKDLYPLLELEWDNLLLGCTNCNSTKGVKDVNLSDYVFPHKGNSFSLFKYNAKGLVEPADNLPADLNTKAKAMIDLVGLDKKAPRKGTVAWMKDTDRRQKHRGEAIIFSEDYRKKYSNADQAVRDMMRSFIIEAALDKGFWSIWMHAFEAFPEVQKEIINSYKGTNTTYFRSIINHQ